MLMRKKPMVIFFAAVTAVVVLVPALLVLPYSSASSQPKDMKPVPSISKDRVHKAALSSSLAIPVYRTGAHKVEKVAMEEYVKGVVAAEMPVHFQAEALKAQALSARTYIARMMEKAKRSSLPKNAVVTDSIADQVYKSGQELKKQWGKEYSANMKKIAAAVEATEGQILTYDGKPIFASFFSTSNGYTENSEDYWGTEEPYLKSVKSPWDAAAVKVDAVQKIPVQQAEAKLGVSIKEEGLVGKVTARTEGKKIASIMIGGKAFKGKEVREKLGLRSADFTLLKEGSELIAKTKGYGHGVGMSQYGANGMAAAGKTYKDIVKHYYQGVAISSYKPGDKALASAR